MKNLLLIIAFTAIALTTHAQVICVQCFHQNAPIGIGANNLILNGGMENSDCTPGYIEEYLCQSASFYSCDLDNWTCTGGGSSTYACIFGSTSDSRSLVPEGGRAVYLGNSFCNACSGVIDDTSCLENSGCVVMGIPSGYPNNYSGSYGETEGCTLQQIVTGLVPGNTYILEFWAGGEVNDPYFDADGLFAVDLGFGNIMLRNKPTPYNTGVGTRFIILFNATATVHTIKFINWGHICLSCTELVLDDVKLYTIQDLPPHSPVSLCGVGISELNENEANIFPNPVADELTVKTADNEPSELTIYDLASRILIQQTFTSTTTVNTKQLPNGMYLYELRNKNNVIKNGKIIKE